MHLIQIEKWKIYQLHNLPATYSSKTYQKNQWLMKNKLSTWDVFGGGVRGALGGAYK